MPDFSALRRTMVDTQVRTSDVTDKRLLAAMLDLPRERFVPPQKADLAYLDLDIPVSEPGRPRRWMLKPMVLAKLLQAAEAGEIDHVLDVGCATGYSAALLGRLAGHVTALEEDTALAQIAKTALAALDANNVTVTNGPLSTGVPAGGPYDVIVMEGASEIEPRGLLRQLKDDGRLICVMKQGPAGKAMLYRARQGEFSGLPIFDASAPILPGFAKTPEFVF
jgi:protein-L-isoaspartate(D-aspartate) O-methyltransferase